MTFTKPKDISYTDMCIYIDNNVYEETFDENLVYEYIYHIVLMLAQQGQIFKHYWYYDDFAIFAANRIYFRLTNKKQWEFNSSGEPKLEKIKSVLNYAKSILYPLRVDFEQSEYCQSISREAFPEEIDYNFSNLITTSIDELTFCEFGLTLNNIGNTCRAFLKTIPFDVNSSEWLNIYTSVMLTFLNNVTLPNKKIDRINHLVSTNRLTDNHIIDAYDEESNQKPILFHLPESMADYIVVLSRQLKNLIAKDLTEILHTNISSRIELIPSSVKDYMDSYEDTEDEN